MSFLPNSDFRDLIATVSMTGNWKGKNAYIVEVLGKRSAFANTTDLFDTVEFLTSGQTSYIKPTTADSFQISSTNAGDTAAGAGVQSVKINFLDASGNTQTTTVTLNGTTPVSVTAMNTNCTFVQFMHTATVGSNGAALGDIILENATPTTIYEQITAGGNQSLSARYMIPTGYTGYILNWTCGAIRQAQDARLRSNTDKTDRTVIVPGFLFLNTIYLGADNNFVSTKPFISIPAGAEVKVSSIAQATSGSPRFDSTFAMLLLAN